MILHLGVHDIAYAARFSSPKTRANKARTMSRAQMAYGGNKTTGDVAEILESKYHIMQTFFDMEQSDIIAAFEASLSKGVRNVMAGQPGPIDIASEALERVKTKFKQNLSMRRYDGIIPGVPTKAATQGVSHRFKQPYKRRPERPSFIDTGMYQSSFTAWVT